MSGVLEPEAGIFYGVCWFVVIIRLISRRIHRGSWKLLQWDDYLIIVAMVCGPQRRATVVADQYLRLRTQCLSLSCTRSQRLAVRKSYVQNTCETSANFLHRIVGNLIPPGDDVSQYSETEINMRIYGSKLVLVAEQMQLLTIWLVKACLLIMYNRMTLVLPQHKIVVATSIYVAVAFVVMEVLYLGVWCRPFSQYWAVPPNSSEWFCNP
jgi:hypothetical protein